MSAFLCSPKHLATIAVWGAHVDPARCLVAGRLIKKLLDENIASLEYRYPNTRGKVTQDFAGITYAEFLDLCQEEADKLDPDTIEIPAVSKLIDSYAYQSCEHPGWESSEVCAMCVSLSRIADALWAVRSTILVPAGHRLRPMSLRAAAQPHPWSI